PLPDVVQTRFFVEPLDEGRNSGEPRGIRGQIGLFDFWSQSRRAVQIESERNILGERFRSIRLTMLLVELAHRGSGLFGSLGLLCLFRRCRVWLRVILSRLLFCGGLRLILSSGRIRNSLGLTLS